MDLGAAFLPISTAFSTSCSSHPPSRTTDLNLPLGIKRCATRAPTSSNGTRGTSSSQPSLGPLGFSRRWRWWAPASDDKRIPDLASRLCRGLFRHPTPFLNLKGCRDWTGQVAAANEKQAFCCSEDRFAWSPTASSMPMPTSEVQRQKIQSQSIAVQKLYCHVDFG